MNKELVKQNKENKECSKTERQGAREREERERGGPDLEKTVIYMQSGKITDLRFSWV